MIVDERDETAPADMAELDFGQLANDEFINRVIYDPEWFGEDGELTPGAISVSDLKNRGFSLNRDFVKEHVVRRLIADARASQPNARADAMISRFLTRDVRDLEGIVPNRKVPKGQVQQPEKLFSAHASPQPEDTTVQPPFPANPAHAHVLSLHPGDGTIKALRAKLLPLLKNIISIDEFVTIINQPESGNAAGREP